MNKIKKIILPLLVALCGLGVNPGSVRAQFIGYTSPQTVLSTVASGVSCTGTPQNFSTATPALNVLNFRNLGQTQHSVALILSGAPSSGSLQIQGIDTAGTVINISPIVQPGGTITTINGSGAYAQINIVVTCSAGQSFNLTYSGASATTPVVGGTQFGTLIDQFIFNGLSGASNQTGIVFGTPFGSSSGVLRFQYNSANVAGSSLTVLCINNNGGASVTLNQFVFSLANALGTQTFRVPPATCPQVQVTYTSGGAGGNIQVEYILDAPGDAVNTTLSSYTHIVGTTATAVKATSGTLVGITVNTPAVGTISVFDLATAACTGTPSTNVVAVITATATAPYDTFAYNVSLLNGICVKASAAMDVTVSSQ
jgi:hypothetical protein